MTRTSDRESIGKGRGDSSCVNLSDVKDRAPDGEKAGCTPDLKSTFQIDASN
jgi:hypothetical protein